MMKKGKIERGVVELVDTESLVPEEHLLRKVDKAVDFRKLYETVEPLYSEEDGRPSVDPVVLFKIVLLQHLDGIPSLRGTLRRAQTDIAYRWFLGYTLNEEIKRRDVLLILLLHLGVLQHPHHHGEVLLILWDLLPQH